MKKCTGSAGIDNETHLSCKRRDIKYFVQMDEFKPEIPKIRVRTFQMSGKFTDLSKTSPEHPLL